LSSITWFEVPGLMILFQSSSWSQYLSWNIPYFAAKVLGGGGAVNGMVFWRHIPADFEVYPMGWQWSDVLDYYKKIENVTMPELRNSSIRGHQGLIQVSRNLSRQIDFNSMQSFVDTVQNYGIPFNPDFNGESRYGLGFIDANIGDGCRSASVNAYLAPVFKNSKLTVLLNSVAVKIIFDNTKKAIGVTYVKEDTTQTATVYAKNEIILTAGSFGTPKLLMLSGIGNATDLQNLQISVIADLPGVGKKLKDHLALGVEFLLKPGYDFPVDTFNDWVNSFANYAETRQGLLAGLGRSLYFFYLYYSSSLYILTFSKEFINYLWQAMGILLLQTFR